MFFSHQQLHLTDERVALQGARFDSDFDSAYLAARFAALAALPGRGTPVETVRVRRVARKRSEEEYSVAIDREILIETPSLRGALHALADLKDMALSEGVRYGRFSDAPVCPFRAYRAFLPARAERTAFFEAMDFLTDFKYNTVILELGGAMQYRRHPEINEAWQAFAADVLRYSGRSLEIQQAYAWEKDSIHVENAGGEVLTQEEVKDIFDRLRAMGFDVVPEVPTLSHADYICLAHPELAERKEDPYPDTYCPSDERSYRIVFDILDEVIDLLAPACVHIGHDEYYSMALCDRCRGKEPVALYVGDITRIHDYLADRGVATMMWGEKLLDARQRGERVGGAGVDRINEAGYRVTVPPLYPCAALLPRDIFMLNWYWEFGAHHDRTFAENGYRFAYGNLYGADIDRWSERIAGGTEGGAVSNWGSFDAECMQRNLQWYSLAATAFLLWSATGEERDALARRTADALYRRYLGELPADRIEIEHVASVTRPHDFFYGGIFPSPDDRMGSYRLVYDDGATADLPVAYGLNIAGPAVETGSHSYAEVLYSTLPVGKDGAMRYRTAYANPRPGHAVQELTFVPRTGCDVQVEVKLC